MHDVGGGDSGLVEQEGTRLVLGERDEDILPEDRGRSVNRESAPPHFPHVHTVHTANAEAVSRGSSHASRPLSATCYPACIHLL